LDPTTVFQELVLLLKKQAADFSTFFYKGEADKFKNKLLARLFYESLLLL
jgi:hypothetical protein